MKATVKATVEHFFEPIPTSTRLSRAMIKGFVTPDGDSISGLGPRLRALVAALLSLLLGPVVGISGCSEGPVLFGLDAGQENLSDGRSTDAPIHIGMESGADCEGAERYVSIPSGTGETLCSGQLAERTFRFSLCSCSDVLIFGGLYTSSFDSAQESFEDEDNVGGSVGVNGDLDVLGILEVGGTAIQTGVDGVTFYGETAVRGDLKVAGDVTSEEGLTVDRDAVVGGDLNNLGQASIGRDLYLGGVMASDAPPVPAGALISGPVAVDDPCSCGDDELIDVPAIVAAARDDNRNEDVGLSPESLDAIRTTVDVTLPCGRYFLTSIGGAGRLTFHIDGPVALFIEGDVDLLGDLDLLLGENGTLDIFVAGQLELTGLTDFWDITQPSKVRFYVGGEEDVYLTNVTGFNLYAPRARVILGSATFALGSIFAGDFLAMDDTGIHYDRDVLREGDRCDADAFGPSSCGVTGGACAVDADCCAPLICDREQCQPLGVLI